MAKSKSQKKQSKQQEQSGGDGAADHALKVFGNMNDQHAVSSIDNTIVMKGGELDFLQEKKQDSPEVAPVSGGKQSKKQLKNTIKKQLKQLKQQGGESLKFSEYSSATQSDSTPSTTDARVAVHANGDGNQTGGDGKQLNLQKGFLKAGDKMSKQQLQQLNQQLDKLQQQQQGGVGLNEIVVPLILLYASQGYGQGKTAKKSMTSVRKSLRLTK
jgi:hypothetical protein